MTSDSTVPPPRPSRPLAGAKAWIITDGKAGMDVQARGVADALGLDYQMLRVEPRGVYKVMAPWGPVDRREQFGTPGSRFAPPWPQVAIATGRASIPYIRAIKKQAGAQTFTVVLQDPKSGPATADLIWVPAHDTRRGANVFTTLTAPHSFTAQRLSALRRSVPEAIARLPAPRIAVMLGGKNGVYKFTDEDDARLCGALASLAQLGASFLITPSRRTHQRLIQAAEVATRNAPRIFWNGEGPNPYADFLAHADTLIVTADSVNMTGEACATGKPVYVFEPSRGSAKFRRFHEALRGYGATRVLPAEFTNLESWSYEPLDSAQLIACEVERRWTNRVGMLSGLIGIPDKK